jgi:dephospho-CoA kinase
MIRVGITGGIGSGKTTVCEIFESLGIPVYYADREAKKLMHKDTGLKDEIIKHFGQEIYDLDMLDRKKLAAIVFHDKAKLKLLNSLVHPAVQRDVKNWMNKQTGVPYAIKEAALLFESGSYGHLDKIITVVADDETRINRIMKRDHVSKEDVLARMKNQWPQKDKINKSDFVIYNNEKDVLVTQVIAINRSLIANNKLDHLVKTI